MAAEAPLVESTPAPEVELDEANITSSLARLQELHFALRNLREIIPRLMDSVLVDPPGPENLHLHFAEAARAAASDIKNFAQNVEDPYSREVLEKAKESRAKNAEDITNWLVTEHEDWLDAKRDDLDEDGKLKIEGTEALPPPAEMKAEDVQGVLERFKEAHSGIEASMEEPSRTIQIYLPSPAYIHFEVRPETIDEGQSRYIIDSKEKTKLHKAIIEEIAARRPSNDLGLLLGMLASYADIKSRPCVICTRLLDRNAQFPVRRSRTRTKQGEGPAADFWEASHPACC